MRSRSLIILAVAVVGLGAFILFVERHQPTSDERRERADRVLPELDADEIVDIALETSDGAVRLVKTDGEWRLTEPVFYAADPAAVLGLLEAVAGLDAVRRLDSAEVDGADYGLDDPALSVELTDRDGRTFGLEIGGTTLLGGRRAVRRDDADEVLVCSDTFVSRLDRPADDWRSREVVAVAEHELAAIEIEAGQDRIEVERIDGRWRLQEPVADLADQEQIASLVSELNGLRVREFVAAETDPAALGLDDAEFRIRLDSADDGPPITLELAAPVGDAATVVCRRNDADLFRVPDTLRLRLGKAPVLWRSELVWPFSTWDVATVSFVAGADETAVEQVDGMWQMPDGSPADGAEVRRRLGRLAELEAEAHDLILPPTEVLGSVALTVDSDGEPASVRFTFYAAIEEGGNAAVTVTGRDNVMAVDAAVVDAVVGNLGALTLADEVGADE